MHTVQVGDIANAMCIDHRWTGGMLPFLNFSIGGHDICLQPPSSSCEEMVVFGRAQLLHVCIA